MTVVAVVRQWNADQAWGVLDSPETPGGCWAHLTSVAATGPWDIRPGDEYLLEWERAPQDGFGYRALRLWPTGTDPVDRVVDHGSTAYTSSLTLSFDDEDRRSDDTRSFR